MKKILLTLTILALSVSTYATPFEDFLKVNTISATFRQDNSYHGLDNFTLNGKVSIVRGKIALWDYSDPVEYYLLKPDGVEHYSADLNQLVKMKIDTNKIDDPGSLMLSIFLDTSKIKSKFKIEDKGNTVILTPINIPDLKSIVLAFAQDRLAGIITSDTSGNLTQIMFSDMKYNIKISDDTFVKKLPKDVEIVE